MQGRVCSAEFVCLHVTVITDLPNSNISKIYYIMMIWAFYFFILKKTVHSVPMPGRNRNVQDFGGMLNIFMLTFLHND